MSKGLHTIAALVAASMGVGHGGFAGSHNYFHHHARDLTYTDSGKPMSKRRKRRLRAKAKQEQSS